MAQQHWDSVVSAALVGVNGRSVSADGADPAVAGYLSGTTNPGEIVLYTAAMMSTAARATVEVIGNAEPITPAPADARPPMTERAAQLAYRAMQVDPEMADWARRAILASGRAPTPTLLPILLRQSSRGGPAATAIAQIVGETGRWLSAHAPELNARLPHHETTESADTALLSDDTPWTHGSPDDRLRYLRTLRRVDPQRGVELLAAGWSAETGPDREALIGALSTGVTPADEPFLERALDDRRKDVRRQAAQLLTARDDSALQSRLAAMLFTIVTAHAGRLGRRRIVVDRRIDIPESLARDGIVSTPPRGTARFDHVLGQLISAVPLSRWESHFSMTPAKILAALPADDDGYPSLFADAVERQGNREWARALAAHLTPTAGVAALIGDDALMQAALAELDAMTPTSNFPALRRIPTPWPNTLARSAFDAVRRRATTSGGRRAGAVSTPVVNLLGLMRVGLPVDDASPDDPGRWVREFISLRAVATDWGWPNQLAATAEALQLRIALTRELS